MSHHHNRKRTLPAEQQQQPNTNASVGAPSITSTAPTPPQSTQNEVERLQALLNASEARATTAEASATTVQTNFAAYRATVEATCTLYEYLSRPLLQPIIPTGKRKSRKTGDTSQAPYNRPEQCQHWHAFDIGLQQFMQTQEQTPTRTLLKSAFPIVPTNHYFDAETAFYVYWGAQRTQICEAMFRALDDPRYDTDHVGFGSAYDTGKGRKYTDEFCHVKVSDAPVVYQPGYFMEYTDRTVPVLTSVPPHAAYDRGERSRASKRDAGDDDEAAENVYSMVGQLFTYMSTLDNEDHRVRYGIFSNYIYWCFCQVDSNDILRCSSWYHYKTPEENGGAAYPTRAAFAYFLTLVVGDGGVPVVVVEKPMAATAVGTLLSSSSSMLAASMMTTTTTSGPAAGTTTTSSSTLFGRKEGNKQAGIPPTRKDALIFRPGEVLSDTSKAVTHRGVVEGRALVWKLVDMYKTPKHTEWTHKELMNMMENESRVYKHLENVQGQIVPFFVYWGQDWAVWWAMVTSYEGIPLEELRAEGMLDVDTRLKALESLKALHSCGVIHGDVELRNAVRRERDGAVLWVDFERGILMDDFGGHVEEFTMKAEWEEMRLARMLGLEGKVGGDEGGGVMGVTLLFAPSVLQDGVTST